MPDFGSLLSGLMPGLGGAMPGISSSAQSSATSGAQVGSITFGPVSVGSTSTGQVIWLLIAGAALAWLAWKFFFHRHHA